jgi:dihydropyrimidine dehydrogenase (NAD+) subunit PreA/dihydroorotate dehydrogenase (NAD+) catalytic subunit
MPPDLTTQLGPVHLRHPVVCGSGEHVSSLDQLKAAVDAGAAAVVAKSSNESDAARRQWDAIAAVWVDDDRREVPAGDGASILNRSGLVPQPWSDWVAALAEADDYARTRDSWVAASLIPADAAVLPELARDVERAGVRWLELNLSAPHATEAVPGAIVRPGDPQQVEALVAGVRAAVSVPLSVKLGAEQVDVVASAAAARAAGADVLVIMGRHMGFLPDPETREPLLGSFGGYSGPWALPLSLRWVAKTRLALGREVPLVGTNGARNGLDVARFLLAGASAVQVATSVIAEGFGAITRMVDELTSYLERQGVNARDVVGEAADRSISYEEAALRSRT